MIDKNMSLGQIVVENPQVIDTLSNLGLDFCCGGEMSLKEAADQISMDQQVLMDKLESIPKLKEGQLEEAIELSTPKLLEYIVNYHHVNEVQMMEEIDYLLQKILRVHFKNHGQDLKKIYGLFMALKGELLPHFYQEEILDFPDILAGRPIEANRLIEDHQGAGVLLDELEDFTQGFTPPQDGCATYVLTFQKLKDFAQDLHKHVFLENQVLFKRLDK